MSGDTAATRREQIRALLRVANHRPLLTVGIVFGGIFAALLEGIGLSFILPIVELVQASGDPTRQADGAMLVFIRAFEWLGVPLTLGTVVIGVSIVLTIRWTTTFVVRWLRGALAADYTRELQRQLFENALDTQLEFFDHTGSDDILNAIVTQAEYAGRAIRRLAILLEQAFLTLMYVTVAFLLSPLLTAVAVVFMGGVSWLFRTVVEPGYDIGDRVANANERIQRTAQAGIQGIRETKLFGLESELFSDFVAGVDQYARSIITHRRNEQAIQSFYNLLTAISVFVLIYLALTVANLSLSSLGVFLFAMFRLGPKASAVNKQFYRVENNLPHLVRTQSFLEDLSRHREQTPGKQPAPQTVETVTFDAVTFSYEGQAEVAVRDVSFSFEKGEFIGLVGPSGAGKSTIASLLARLYEPDSGEIRANDTSIHAMEVDAWRDKIAVVRQTPYIFNDTLRYNLMIANSDASIHDLERVCHLAKVDEFLDELPDGYDTQLGDEGVRLSGGQRQRIALARALLKDADILVLDQATSDLDSELETQIQTALEELRPRYAIVAIAHRLSTIRNADRIYIVDDGEIVESGTHAELLDLDGKYADLHTAQSQR